MTKVLSLFRHRRNDLDLTQGSIAGNLIQFALPLLAGNLFQQLYNLVDTWVIGQTGVDGAYAAVGPMGPVINIFIGFFLGLSTGAGVVISQYFGAGNYERVQKTVHTAITMTLIMAAIFTVVGVLMTPYLLTFMLHNQDGASTIYPHAKTYITIYFSGVVGLMVYNIGAGILRAIGDSQRPFHYLIVSALTNIVLDLAFVFGLDMGVAGVALATIIAQAASAVLVVIALLRTTSCVKLTPRALGIDRNALRQIVRVGIPAALQMALTAFANVFVQSYIADVNVIPPDGFSAADAQAHCMGGWTTYSKIDMFIFMPVQSLALATTTFVGQNLGSGSIARAKKGTKIAFLMALAAAATLIAIVMIFARPISALINDDPYILEYAVTFLRYISPFYLLCCVNQVFSAALRGAGNSRAPMIIMLSTFVGVRQIYMYVMSNFISNDPIPVGMGYPIGWLACATVTLIYYNRFRFENSRLVTDQ